MVSDGKAEGGSHASREVNSASFMLDARDTAVKETVYNVNKSLCPMLDFNSTTGSRTITHT